MFTVVLTSYGQTQVSSTVIIDGIILLLDKITDFTTLSDISSYTITLDEEACGNLKNNIGNVLIQDLSNNEYQVKTILFYKNDSGKKILGGYSQATPLIQKTSQILNLLMSFDFSAFTNGFLFSLIQAGNGIASHNTDGLIHIEDPNISSDNTYSVYNKAQIDELLQDKQTALSAGNGISLSDNIVKTTGIPFGIVDSTSTSTVYTVTVPGIYKLEDGVCCLVKNGVVTSASGFTLNVNGLGAKPCYSNMAAATRETTIFNKNYTMLFVYDSTRIEEGAWVCYRGYYSDANSIAYQIRGSTHTLPTTGKFVRYRLLFTSADGTKFVPSNISTSTNATAKIDVVQTPIDPFGEIVYYSATAAVDIDTSPDSTYLWTQYAVTLGYSFNRTGAALVLTFQAPVYLKCAPQSNGSAIIDADNPYVQSLPNTNDGKIYIFLGIATSATAIELLNNHPIYYHDGAGIRIWTGKDCYSKSDADASFVPVARTVNSKALSSDITLNLDDVPDGSSRVIPTDTGDLTNNAGFITSAELPTVNDSTITIKKSASDTGDSFTTNNTIAKTINLGLHTVATSGSYNDLSNRPTIPTVNNAKLTIKKTGADTGTEFTANADTDVTCNLDLATVATSGSYNDLSNRPTIPSLSNIVASAQYNSTTGNIEFYNSSGTKLNTDISAEPFTKDGLIDSISVITQQDASGIKSITLDAWTDRMSTIKVVRDAAGLGLSEAKDIVEGALPAVIYTGDDADSVYTTSVLGNASYNPAYHTFTYHSGIIDVKKLKFQYNTDANKQDVIISTSDLCSDYVTLNTSQTITGAKVFSTDILPETTLVTNLGSTQKRWHYVYTNILHASGNITASSFVKANGTSLQFLKADGSVDSNTYLTSASLSDYVTTNTAQTITSDKTMFVDTDSLSSNAAKLYFGGSNTFIGGELNVVSDINKFKLHIDSDDSIKFRAVEYTFTNLASIDSTESNSVITLSSNVTSDGNTITKTQSLISNADIITFGKLNGSSLELSDHDITIGANTENIIPNGTTSLGSSSNQFVDVYASEFHGDLDGRLSTSRKINNVSFDGSTDISSFGTCTTGASSQVKVATLSNYSLVDGTIVVIKFTYTNTATNPYLNINSTGAKRIYFGGYAAGTDTATSWIANEYVVFIYNGGYDRYYIIGKMLGGLSAGLDTLGRVIATSYTRAITATDCRGTIGTAAPTTIPAWNTTPNTLAVRASASEDLLSASGLGSIIAGTLRGFGVSGFYSSASAIMDDSVRNAESNPIGTVRLLGWERSPGTSAKAWGDPISDGVLHAVDLVLSSNGVQYDYYSSGAAVSGTWVTLSVVAGVQLNESNKVFVIIATRVM